MSKKLINSPQNAVNESLEGFVNANSHVVRQLEHCPRVIVRSDLVGYKTSGRVSLLCGGGSGHEPVFSGYVGRGALTAAVAGSVFASPPASHILEAIKAVSSKAGTVIFVFNYTGDRLNFGLALERAKQFGFGPLRMVVLGEDTALESKDKSAGRRGLAGSLMALKIAGAMAEDGCSVDQIADETERISKEMGTLGLSLSSCSLPGQEETIFHLNPDEMEVGLGVHGEPGVKRVKMLSARETIDQMLSHLTRNSPNGLPLHKDENIAIFINNLCSMTQIEMNIVTGEVLKWFCNRSIKVIGLYAGTLFTSLEMQGISISALQIKDTKWLDWLNARTDCVAWPRQTVIDGCVYGNAEPIRVENSRCVPKMTDRNSSSKVDTQTEDIFKKILKAICKTLIENESELNRLDQAAGDGDCGTTIKNGASAVLRSLSNEELQFNQPSICLQKISEIWEENTGGTTGAIYALLLSSVASKIQAECSCKTIAQALKYSTEAIMRYGHAEPGDRTLVDPLMAAVKVLDTEQPDLKTFQNAVQAVETAARETASMKAGAGRASYVSEDNLTLPDAGATAVALWMRAAFDTYLTIFTK